MNEVKRPVNSHKAYHAHVYFDEATVDFASELCREAGQRFGLQVGRVHEKLVGPHPMWSCQIIFGSKDFEQLISWLDEHRNGLTVLVHALSGNDLDDHTHYAYWLGDSQTLDVSQFTA
ncbi:DOPA 4,5-dioxygenase family protein [Dasania sp. GY-MA-18]|uniref:DOPA 4,5-dioxygenase family protein n=1 Tax=Dasania phycosphaerae TaxID=2950436 RepID=A0A9J6RK68_9GAMM|nr:MULTISPECIES: DOPA 4,5-dioxygenase family protein [Dasania]MCR8922163.1 DOPA 4,5-dioxygenase family protein [Dasania sp. GY-MA-18]MCZ0864591.1 DOPA 4,5-dioxygenase family protein [Dasania phycosphaerae]MCZ0868319.1 DOPA 4,5-dioxygenase family protein [Dasania phycosphaerae]